ncbi:hypothetical protein [Chryseobacterium sp. H1D6B]|uniref:hypothetical protein n=1 Tax=Chryseobacterium sp. H1D6B TaxID=2940588 RepID=UPI0015C88D2D|nr:hypothetical protein [Chryseobacterium sp. H1D6B]
MSKLFSEKVTDKNDKNYHVYKIKGKLYETDEKTFFSSEKRKIFENKTNDNVDFRTYKKRYLFIGYYPKVDLNGALPSSVPTPLNRLEIIDLEDLSKKWAYELNRGINMIDIHSFNPENGVIIYNYYIRPKR